MLGAHEGCERCIGVLAGLHLIWSSGERFSPNGSDSLC